MHSFLLNDPFKGRVRERKSKLKIKMVAVEAMLMKRKDMIKQSAIASKKNHVTK